MFNFAENIIKSKFKILSKKDPIYKLKAIKNFSETFFVKFMRKTRSGLIENLRLLVKYILYSVD